MARLRDAIFESEGRQLRRSIRVSPRDRGDWAFDYLSVPDALDSGSHSIVGWWVGEAADAVGFLGEPEGEVPLVRGSDLDLAVWRVASNRLPHLVMECGVPTVLASAEPGWVLVAPPASNEMFLYPELSASDG